MWCHLLWKSFLYESFVKYWKWKQNWRNVLLCAWEHSCTLFTHVCEYILYVHPCCFSKPLLKKAATESHHYSSGQNECAWVLNGTHLFPLRVLRQRRYPLAGRIPALYYTPNWKRASGVRALKACLYLVQPDSMACWSGCSHGLRHPREPRAYIYTHTHTCTHTR